MREIYLRQPLSAGYRVERSSKKCILLINPKG